MERNTDLINVRLPTKIVSWLDSLVKEGVYKSRSEAIRDAIRGYVRRKE